MHDNHIRLNFSMHQKRPPSHCVLSDSWRRCIVVPYSYQYVAKPSFLLFECAPLDISSYIYDLFYVNIVQVILFSDSLEDATILSQYTQSY